MSEFPEAEKSPCAPHTRSESQSAKAPSFWLFSEAFYTRPSGRVADGADGHGGVRSIAVSFVRLLLMAWC